MTSIAAKNTVLNADITSELTVLSHVNDGDEPRLYIPRVDLYNIGGGGHYTLKLNINGDILTPISSVAVDIGQTSAILMGRHPVGVTSNEYISIIVLGLTGDSDVTVVASLFDATPVNPEDLTNVLDQINNVQNNVLDQINNIQNDIIDQINNIEIVAIKERIVFGACSRPTVNIPQSLSNNNIVRMPAVIQRTVSKIPQVIPQLPISE